MTGPEYAARFSDQVQELGIEYKTDTMVLEVEKGSSAEEGHCVTAINTIDGLMKIRAKAVILATGCRGFNHTGY